MKKEIDDILKNTVENCFELGILSRKAIPSYVIEIPNNPDHGHFATNLALTLASSQKMPPRKIAQIIADNLIDKGSLLEKIEVAGPGFLNFKISFEKWHRIISDILSCKQNYGRSSLGEKEKVIVEFISANPTGPLHLGHGRGAALGDTLCRILAFCGYNVVREFYINDAGQQIRLLGESIFSRLMQMNNPEYDFPDSGYHGEYIQELADKISKQICFENMSKEEAVEILAEKGKEIMLQDIKHDLSSFRVEFDIWYSESELHNSLTLDNDLKKMETNGHLYEKDGALWIKTTDYGDDKDRVLKKKDGQFTYFASDISYHLDKYKRGFTKAINIWGADHHGYVPRIKAALFTHGVPDNWLSVMLIQLVKLWKSGQEIKMSKRAGNFVTLQELVDEVGVDAVRFVFLSKNHDSTLDFDIDMVKKQDSENPVYYVQYAHARICSIFRKAEEEGIALPDNFNGVLELLVLKEELALVRKMAEFPSLLEEISKTLEPHRLTYYLTDLASSFHRYFNLGTKLPENRIVSQNKKLSQARLILSEAIRTVISNGLELLGITAPERM
ncbi:MAG: arginine--tRNA ligase [Deltaproteobacteria bacterium]|nr:arginine--tRNA ligase [Deltaproteobacteria bacterium]